MKHSHPRKNRLVQNQSNAIFELLSLPSGFLRINLLLGSLSILYYVLIKAKKTVIQTTIYDFLEKIH